MSNFELPLCLICIQIDIKVTISIKYQCNTIVWAKIKHLRHFFENFLVAKAHTSCKFLKLCWHFWATKIHMDKIFPIWIFFLKRPSYRYYYEKNQIGPTSSSYINLTMKLLIKLKNTPKNRANFGKPYLSFASDRLFIFLGFIMLEEMMQIN